MYTLSHVIRPYNPTFLIQPSFLHYTLPSVDQVSSPLACGLFGVDFDFWNEPNVSEKYNLDFSGHNHLFLNLWRLLSLFRCTLLYMKWIRYQRCSFKQFFWKTTWYKNNYEILKRTRQKMFSIHIFLYSRFFSLVCPKITNIHDFRLFHFLYNHDYFVLFRKVVLFYISSICVSKVFLLYLYVLCPSLSSMMDPNPLYSILFLFLYLVLYECSPISSKKLRNTQPKLLNQPLQLWKKYYYSEFSLIDHSSFLLGCTCS